MSKNLCQPPNSFNGLQRFRGSSGKPVRERRKPEPVNTIPEIHRIVLEQPKRKPRNHESYAWGFAWWLGASLWLNEFPNHVNSLVAASALLVLVFPRQMLYSLCAFAALIYLTFKFIMI